MLVVACSATEPAAIPLANRAAASADVVAWSASSIGDGNDGEPRIEIAVAVAGRIVTRDVMCCEPVMADQCHPHADGPDAVYMACADALTRWQAALVRGAIIITRIDTMIESRERERRIELARIPTAATSLVLAQNGMSSSGPPPPPPPPPPP